MNRPTLALIPLIAACSSPAETTPGDSLISEIRSSIRASKGCTVDLPKNVGEIKGTDARPANISLAYSIDENSGYWSLNAQNDPIAEAFAKHEASCPDGADGQFLNSGLMVFGVFQDNDRRWLVHPNSGGAFDIYAPQVYGAGNIMEVSRKSSSSTGFECSIEAYDQTPPQTSAKPGEVILPISFSLVGDCNPNTVGLVNDWLTAQTHLSSQIPGDIKIH